MELCKLGGENYFDCQATHVHRNLKKNPNKEPTQNPGKSPKTNKKAPHPESKIYSYIYAGTHRSIFHSFSDKEIPWAWCVLSIYFQWVFSCMYWMTSCAVSSWTQTFFSQPQNHLPDFLWPVLLCVKPSPKTWLLIPSSSCFTSFMHNRQCLIIPYWEYRGEKKVQKA